MISRHLLPILLLLSSPIMADSFFSWPFSGNKSTPAEQADEQPEAQQETTIADPVPEQSERIGQPAPNWTPTPAPLSYDSLWDRMRDNFAIPNLDSALVREWEQYYAARPEQLYRISERGKRYMYHVVDELEKRSMPLDLALLPMIESAYNPRAYSPAHASGIWQFIPSTGKNYGLEQTWWYDGRRDVLAATEAALDYLNYLYGLFGDWHLALASYNWGEGAVSRALAKNRAKGLPEDYSNIGLPNETLNYVPKLLAVRNLIANPEAWGIRLPDIPNRPYFSVVTAPHHMDTQVAAKLAGMSVDEFVNLNPAFTKPIIAYKPSRRLLLPADKADAFSENLSSFDGPLLSWEQYTTTPGERYLKIAARFGTSLAKLREVNNIGNSKVAHGEILMVPRSSGDPQQPPPAPEFTNPSAAMPAYARLEKVEPSSTRQHVVRKGDTVFNISRRYDLSVTELVSMNRLKSHTLRLGQPLTVARLEPVRNTVQDNQSRQTAKAQQRSIRYTAKRGDTLYSIARKFNVDIDDVKTANPRQKKTSIKAGDVLQIMQ
ncbi:MAG: hypothetical protein RL210_1020 [Pseudomonadota bacterium]|jgi:membrane-bound lytic murein transglycosylase D|nr:rane-bound lytic murein transglycosylase [Pseudomonadota bacterium]